MTKHIFSLVSIGVVMLTGSLLFAPQFAPARVPVMTAPVEAAGLVERATEAVNARNASALANLTAGDAKVVLPWMTETSTQKWVGGVLTLPAQTAENRKSKIENPPHYLAVFHAWHTCESDGDHVHRLEKSGQGWRIGAEIPETETGGFRVRDHALNVLIEPSKKSASISDHVRIERVQTTLPAFGVLRLSQDFQVQQVRRNGPEGAVVPFQQVGGIIAFAPPAEKEFTLYLSYAGTVEHRGSDFIQESEATLNSYWYPHIARLPSTATVTVTVPADWTPISTGEIVPSKARQAETKTVTFRNDIPICYYTISAGRYVVTTRTVRGKTLATYLRSSNPTLAGKSLDVLEKSLTFYEKQFGPFPYSSYTLVETKGPFGGALESYSFATFGPFSLPGAIAHELAHTWWGGMVPCAYTNSMWNESFAEYSDGLFQRMTAASNAESRSRSDARLRTRRRNALAYNVFPMTLAHDTSDGRQSSVGYGKGAMVLRVLEAEIGQETLLRCIREFLTHHKRGEAAEWRDFEAAVNRVTGQDYRWFFAQWAERTGMPAVKLENVKAQENGSGYLIEADIVQTGTPYRLKMPVLVETAEGKSIQETTQLQGERTHLRLNVPSLPKQLTLDPAGVLPLASPPNASDDRDPTVFEFAMGDAVQ